MEEAAFRERSGCIFEEAGAEVEEPKSLVNELYKKIGEQDIELEFLKKSTSSSRTCKERYGGEGEQEVEYSEAV